MLEKKTVTSPIKFKKSAKVSFTCHIRESESRSFHFHWKRHHDLIKTWSFCHCVRFNKMSQTFIKWFLFLFSVFNRSGLICPYYGFCDDRNISVILQMFYRNRNNRLTCTHDHISSYSLYSVDTKSSNQMVRIAQSKSMRV